MNTHSKKGAQFVGNIVNHAFACLETKWHVITKFVDNYINKLFLTCWKVPFDFKLCKSLFLRHQTNVNKTRFLEPNERLKYTKKKM